MAQERLKSHLTGTYHAVGKEMAGSSHCHILTCCLSRLRSSLEAGMKQFRLWLQYDCDVAKVLLYSSFSGPLVLLWCSYGGFGLKMARRVLKQTFNVHTGHSK